MMTTIDFISEINLKQLKMSINYTIGLKPCKMISYGIKLGKEVQTGQLERLDLFNIE